MTVKDSVKVMVMDSEPAILRTISTYLRINGYDCVTFDNAASALDWLDENTAHVIVADLAMEGFDGLDLAKRLRDSGDLAQIIVCSSRLSVDRVVEAYRLGVTDYLLKPFGSLDVIGGAVEQACMRLERWRTVLERALTEETGT